jgi:hypothetical protein
MRVLSEAFTRVRNIGYQGEHSGRDPLHDRVLLVVSGPSRKVDPFVYRQELPQRHRTHHPGEFSTRIISRNALITLSSTVGSRAIRRLVRQPSQQCEPVPVADQLRGHPEVLRTTVRDAEDHPGVLKDEEAH